jgi:septum site-determining protein MinC
MTVTDASAIRFRGRSYFALTLTPEPPLAAWLERLDARLARSPGFFGVSPVILDLEGLALSRDEALELVGALAGRGIRILGMEGADAGWDEDGLPPRLNAGREAHARDELARDEPPREANPVAAAPPARAPTPLICDAPVRSGQRIVNPDGDVIVIGSVGSGAEIVAAGSIHVYGALRGRAMAGAYGDEGARIFCRRLEAELIAINGLYQTAEDIEAHMRRQPAQIRLADGAMRVTPFE